ncbi:MAG: metallo-beta-lactamase superfamily protein, partial [Bacilli bacterium]|nr:metallo-beta-lactamase superfamily protein [Bacilli bacterium]
HTSEQKSGSWALIDTGCSTPETRSFWQAALNDYGISRGNLSDVYITHYHPDHVGLAGWLQQEYSAEVHMYGPDRDWTFMQWEGIEEQAQLVEKLFRQNGCPQELAVNIRRQAASQQDHVLPLPENVMELALGEQIELAGCVYEVMWVPGHADSMIALWNPHDQVLISADSILPQITPNVSLWPRCRPNPLDDFLATLDRIRNLNPQLTLPGHGQPMLNTAERANAITLHHEKRIADLMTLIDSGLSTAYDIACSYFRLERLTAHQIRFALAETLAHLEYLVFNGKLVKTDGGVVRYRPQAGSSIHLINP